MKKGDKYREYYIANRDRILEANRERARAKREALREASEAEREAHREKEREKEARYRMNYLKASFEELANITNGDWSTFFNKFADSKILHKMTPKMVDFIIELYREATPLPPKNEIVYSYASPPKNEIIYPY